MADSPSALEGSTLHQLLSDDENRLLDTIDELRSQGIGKLLAEEGLPQLIVCGDQSSGKSSVLEALTHVRFPTKSSVCTTFPTELRLRREPKSRISCRIKASASRSPEQKERLARFQESFDSPEKFPDLITAARNCMSECAQGNADTFFEDILEVEIVGPKLAPLTIVDLPGLIHYRSSSSGERDIKLVKDLVQGYMKKSNSIILAVVSAHNDINNQIVLSHIKDIVPDGSRTLGIITKPDELPSGSEKEQEYLEYAHTNTSKFHYGWHVVRNRTYEEQTSSSEERDAKEMAFFRDSNWYSLPRREVGLGIDSLRQKLSKMLLDHINMSLPSIMEKLEEDLGRSESELSRLGGARSTVKDQLNYLSNISEDFGEYTKDALDGRYHRKAFFGDRLSPEGLVKRLRANVRNLNDEFADRMLKEGHKWHVVEDSEMRSTLFPPQKHDHPNIISKSTFLEKHVDVLAHHERALELPGLSNPLLVSSLFQEQSEPWENIATAHLDTVWEAVKEFLECLLSHLSDERTCNQLLMHVIDPAMEEKRQVLKAKLQELLNPHKHDPINVDPHFARRVWSSKQENITRSVVEIVRQKGVENNSSMLSVDEIMASIAAAETLVDDKYGSRQTYEFMSAYYEMTILVFINNIASLAVEQCLLSGLPKIFSSTTIREMNDEKLDLVASESRDTRIERERVAERVKILQKGLHTLKRIHPSKRSIRLSKPTFTAHTASDSSGPKQSDHIAGIFPSVAHTPLPTRSASATPPREAVPNSGGLFPTSSSNSTIPASATSRPKTPTVSAPADSVFTTLGQKKSTESNPFKLPSQATPTSNLFGNGHSTTTAGASPLGTSTPAAAAVQPPSSVFSQGFGQNSSSTPTQHGGGGLFGGGSKPAPAATGGLFSSSPQPASATTKGLFGSNPQLASATTGGLFSGITKPTSAPTGGLFSNNPQPASATTKGLFGSNPQPPSATTGGLFSGGSKPAPTPTPATTGGRFGGGVKPAPAPATTSNLFGNVSKPAPATTGGLTDATSKSPDRKGMDTGFLVVKETSGAEEQFQFLSSHIPKNKSFEELRLEDYAYVSRRPPQPGFR